MIREYIQELHSKAAATFRYQTTPENMVRLEQTNIALLTLSTLEKTIQSNDNQRNNDLRERLVYCVNMAVFGA